MKLRFFIIFSLAYSWGLIANAQTAEYCSGKIPPPERAKCHKQAFEAHKNNKEFIKFNKQFLQEGDELYRKRRYYKAYRAYDYANAYLPSPYGYLHAAEAVFLSYVHATHFEDDDAKSTSSCLQPSSFVGVVDNTLLQEYKVGVELAKIHKYGPAVSPAYLAQTEKRISCLEAMATQYRGAKTGCVDISKLKACMGITK